MSIIELLGEVITEMNQMRKLIHFFEHLFSCNSGQFVTFWIEKDLWVGFRCDDCDKINNASKTRIRRK